MGYKFETAEGEYDLTPDNSVANLFWHYPYYDYTTYQSPEGKTTAIYSGSLTRWLGGIALTPETQKELKDTQKDLGVYAEEHGGYPRVIIDDHPNEDEYEMMARIDLAGLEDWVNGE